MPSPFFIIGSGRCGATWMYTVLREHPDIAMTDEARVLDFLYFCAELVNVPYSRRAAVPPRESVELRGIVRDPYVATLSPVFLRHVKAICEDFYATYFAGRSYKWWGDKLPDPRAAMAARRVWPDTRYVVLVRDPRDVLTSWRAFAEKPEIARGDPQLVGLAAETLARSWDAVYRNVFLQLEKPLIVRYEDLRREPRRHVGEMLALLGLDWTPQMERVLAAEEVFLTHGTSSSPEASLGRWRTELPAEDVRVVERICGETMERFAYERSVR
jgi:hypothetical protein